MEKSRVRRITSIIGNRGKHNKNGGSDPKTLSRSLSPERLAFDCSHRSWGRQAESRGAIRSSNITLVRVNKCKHNNYGGSDPKTLSLSVSLKRVARDWGNLSWGRKADSIEKSRGRRTTRVISNRGKHYKNGESDPKTLSRSWSPKILACDCSDPSWGSQAQPWKTSSTGAVSLRAIATIKWNRKTRAG